MIKSGDVFGNWKVIGMPNGCKVPCKCTCGYTSTIPANRLLSGGSKGCRKCSFKKISKTLTRHGEGKVGKTVTVEYKAWQAMKKRCFNQNSDVYKYYGGRGITVCERWLGIDGYKNFLADVGRRPTENHSLDRFPNNDGNYEPKNVRWATRKEQCTNRRSTAIIEYDGKKMTLMQLAEYLCLSYKVVLNCYYHRNRSNLTFIENVLRKKKTFFKITS